ncbi:MAG: ABC-2 transporter permease [Lachnospiraceae bacterium]|nr:ABC-2 transporter permease [Lachnospiraceae bacterium]
MKGLIIKDVMCLKKQLTVFSFVLIGVVAVSIMYVLSAKFGNIALAGREMLATEDLTAVDVKNLSSMALIFFMMLPIATVGDMSNVFTADGKAGFAKMAGALPISIKKRLLSKYLTIYALLGLGVIVDVLLAFVLSLLTDIISFADFFGIIISVSSIMGIYSALVIFFCVLYGYGKEEFAQISSLITMYLAFFLIRLDLIKQIIADIVAGGGGTEASESTLLLWQALDFIKEKFWILFVIAALVCMLSYVAALQVAKRKRGVI